MNVERDERGPLTVRRVVVGIDEGAASRAALIFGATVARWLRVPLLAVHVYADIRGGPETQLLRFGDPALVARDTLDGAIERAQVEDGVTYPITPILVRGHSARALVERGGHDGIVVLGRPGRHGRAALPEWSLPARVAAHAQGPIALVPASWQASALAGPVSVGVDLPPSGTGLLQQARGLSQAAQLPLHVVHAEPARRPSSPSPSDADILRRAFETELGRVAAPGEPVSLALSEGAPGSVLEEVSQTSAFLVVGRHGIRHRTPHRLGTVARHVLRTSSCPVVVLDASDHCVPAGERNAARAVSETAVR